VPDGVDSRELTAAADQTIDLSDGIAELPNLDVKTWQKAHPVRLIDEPVEQIAAPYSIDGEALFIDEPQEGPVIVSGGKEIAWGRFADGAVVVLFGTPGGVDEAAKSLFSGARPKLVALAADGYQSTQLRTLAEISGRSALQILEKGLAVEA
jgi:hypothetical protein